MARHVVLQVFLLLSVAILGLPNYALSEEPAKSEKQKKVEEVLDRLRPKVKLGKIPALTLAGRNPLSKEKVAQIKGCIARLAEIEKPDFGLSSTMSGRAFLPLPSQRESGAMLLTNHDLKSSTALETLVAIGPEALPLLLEALADKTPTKLKLEHGGGFGSMWFANELWGNPANELEMKTLGSRKRIGFGDQKHIEEYTVKVGDVCLVAIGQIVGRSYHAVRYQPTANIVINSPTEDAQLREQVQKLWTSDDPVRKLFDSLLLDYSTEGIFNGTSLDGWYAGSDLQIQAAMRLLYYFPKESSALIAERLRKLNVAKTSARGHGSPATEKELDAFRHREVANGVRADEFIEAVSWCPEPKVHESIRGIFTRTDEIDSLLAALPGVDDAKLLRDRLPAFLKALPADEHGAYGDGYNLLVALAKRTGSDAAPIFDAYLQGASPQRGHSAAEALQHAKGEWCIPILLHLLRDKRPTDGYTYAVDASDQNSTRLPIRVCDAAAETLQVHHPELKFSLEGSHKELDEKIIAIREKLSIPNKK